MKNLEEKTNKQVLKLKERFRKVNDSLLTYLGVGALAGTIGAGLLASHYTSNPAELILCSTLGTLVGVFGGGCLNQDIREEIEIEISYLDGGSIGSIRDELYGRS